MSIAADVPKSLLEEVCKEYHEMRLIYGDKTAIDWAYNYLRQGGGYWVDHGTWKEFKIPGIHKQ